MCLDPATIATITAVVAATSAAVQYKTTDNQAKAAEEVANVEAAERKTAGEIQRQQTHEQAASEVNAYQAQAMKERAALDALLGEYGGGSTANRRLSTLGIQNGQDLATLSANAQRRQGDLSMGERADLYSIRSKAAAAPRPSVLGTGLTIASAGLQYGNRLNEINNPKQPGSGVR